MNSNSARHCNSISAWKLHILQGDKSDAFGKNATDYHVYPVDLTISEERAERSSGWRWPGDG